MVRFCPVCGKPDSGQQFIGELCLDCASGRLKPFPTIHILICQKCGEVIEKGNRRKNTTIDAEAERLLKLKGTDPVFSPTHTSVEYDSDYGRVSQPLTLLFEKRICTECSRSSSQYFEAIVQLRGEPAKVARMAEMMSKKLQERTFIPKMEELKEGVDIYCGSRNEAIATLNVFKLGFLRTEKLAGEKNGKRLYRTTLLVRL